MEVMHENQDLQAMDFKAAFGVHCSPAVKSEGTPSPNFAARLEEDGGVLNTENREIWLAQGDVSNGDPSSLFYASDDFPPLPEFPCMSSSSSTSTTSAPSTSTVPNAGLSTSVCSSSSSSSSSSSWAMLKSEAEDDYQHHQQQQQHQEHQSYDDDDGMDGVECMNVMEDFDCMGINQLIEDSNEIWDPTPLFEEDQSQIMPQNQTQTQTQTCDLDSLNYPFQQEFSQSELHHHLDDQQFVFLDPDSMDQLETPQSTSSSAALSEDLAVVFFEWLKSNKESISAEELRSIKIKKSTIESAAKRLGGGREGMKQLLKLILQWVQNHRLHSKRQQLPLQPPPLFPNPDNPHELPPPPPPQCFKQQQQHWMSPPYVSDPASSSFTSMVNYTGHDPYATVHQPYHAPDLFHHHHLINDGSSWAGQPQFPLPPPMHGSMMAPQGFPSYGNGYNPYQLFLGDVGLLRTATMTTSATKEARKKRMARQRRVFTHHHHRGAHNNPNHQQQQQKQQQQQMILQGGGFVDQNAAARSVMIGDHDSAAHGGGWVYWPPTTAGACGGGGPVQLAGQQMMQPPPVAGSQRQAAAASSDNKKQGFKTEKNLKFLLQKVLKQSDVGNLGRIVLPKKEAETHLPELEARDGIPIAMEDIGTSRVWNMRYRFWPNNKSRMYLLENTGDFVRSNGLQEGDFIVIYSDVKCGKYMIRGVKVRPQQQQALAGGSKAELANKPSKAQKTHNSASPSGAAAI